jgi:hypothetical protein
MSDNTVNTVTISLVVGIAVLLIEYLVIKPLGEAPTDKRRKIVIAAIVAASLSAPVALLREVALKVAETVGQSVSVAARVDIYANVYAILALVWGCGWMTQVRPWLYRRLQSLVQNGSEKGEKRNE